MFNTVVVAVDEAVLAEVVVAEVVPVVVETSHRSDSGQAFKRAPDTFCAIGNKPEKSGSKKRRSGSPSAKSSNSVELATSPMPIVTGMTLFKIIESIAAAIFC